MNSPETLYSSSIRRIDTYLEETKERPVRSFFGARIRAVPPLIAGIVDLVATPVFLVLSPLTVLLSSKINKSGKFSAYVITSRDQFTESLKRLYNLPVGIFLNVLYGIILNTSTNVRVQEALGLYKQPVKIPLQNEPGNELAVIVCEHSSVPAENEQEQEPEVIVSEHSVSSAENEQAIVGDDTEDPESKPKVVFSTSSAENEQVVVSDDSKEPEIKTDENVPPSATPLDAKLQQRNESLKALKSKIEKVKDSLLKEIDMWKGDKDKPFREEMTKHVNLLQTMLTNDTPIDEIEKCMKPLFTYVSNQASTLFSFSTYKQRMSQLKKEIQHIRESVKELIKLDKSEKLKKEQNPPQQILTL